MVEVRGQKCKCGCGEFVLLGADYVPGHDLKHRSQLIDKAGGMDKLTDLLKLVDAYMAGEIEEGELAKGIRRLRAQE
jgi:hypothetical protein